MLFIFDCDGVIVDSEIIAAAVDAELLASSATRSPRKRSTAASPA